MPNDRQINAPIEEEMRKSYLDYAMSVIVGRALPDIRDGLKPVHRRVLYMMQLLGLAFNRGYKKSARVVGDCMGKFHPHGDSAIYDTLVRMVQEFSLRYPLVDGQGNYGSIDGDPAAAMRYTEARMARIAHEMLTDIDKDTVDFVPNYDDNEQEPVVLPARIPNLLVNGSTGIAVGMATNIPPHNLSEVVDALILLIDDPNTTIDTLMKVRTGHDLHERVDRRVRVVDEEDERVHDLGQVVGRDVRRHADGDARRSVDQEIGDARREDDRLLLVVVVVRDEVDGVLVDVREHLVRDPRHARFGVAHGGGGITVDRAVVTLAVHERIPEREVLDHPDERVVDG